MPMSSAEIAMQAMMAHQQFAMMNSSFGASDRAAGFGMNAVQNVGAPMMKGGMAMLGLDPMMLGLSAGASAFMGKGAFGALTGGAGLGLAGSMGVAAGVALPLAVGGLGAGYMGSQMMHGAQQQQQLNATLAQTFAFPNQYGRRGFSRGDTSQIGAQMREMAHEVGPGGELTSMRELTEIAGKMGQMGMGRGVRDAQEFNTKFKELIKTVKVVATEMNSSLSQAMEFMQSSKSSGIFRQMDQVKFAKGVQSTAVASGLATSEVAAMGNIGAQISRAYGGLGRQGAMGGMRALGQIGGALQTGALTEEDIYNSTGLTGAEGRQAMASNMMSQTGSFLKSGKGRWMLASMADANGNIDEAAVQQYMMGTAGVGQTRGMAGKHLGEVGRAGFIRNEGRLRGAVMERFGALAPTIALQGWASQRGIDINTMDDRTMLFAQRQLGMGRDQMDDAIKMAQDLPRSMQMQQQQEASAAYGKRIGTDQKTRGIEGAKRKFELAKEKLNAGLQQAGADMYSDLSNIVDKWLDNWMGTAVPAVTENLSGIWRETLRGGAQSDARFHAVFGGGKQGDAVRSIVSKAGGSTMEELRGTSGRMTMEEFAGRNQDITSSFTNWLSGAGDTAKRLGRGGGYDSRIKAISGMETRTQQGRDAQQKALDTMLDEASSVQYALSSGVAAIEVEKGLSRKLLKEYSRGDLGRSGMGDRTDKMMEVLKREGEAGDKEAQAQLVALSKIKDPAERARYVAGMEKAMNIEGPNALTTLAEKTGDLAGATSERFKGMTGRDRDIAMGRAMRGKKGESGLGWGDYAVAGGLFAAGSLMGPMGVIAAGGYLLNKRYGSGGTAAEDRRDEAFSKYTRSEEGMRMLSGIASGDDDALKKAYELTASMGQDGVVGRDKLSDTELAKRDAAGIGLAFYENKDMFQDPDKYSAEERQRAVDDWRKRGGTGKTFEDMRASVGGAYSKLIEDQKANRARMQKELRSEGEFDARRLKSLGVMEKDLETGQYKITTASSAEFSKLGAQSMAAATTQMEMLNAMTRGDDEKVRELSVQKHDQLKGMTLDQLSQHVRASGDQQGAVMLSDAKRLNSLSRKQGSAIGIAAYMGVGGDTKREKRDLHTAYQKGDEEYIKELTRQTGLSFGDNQNFRKALEEARKGGKGSSVAVSTALEEAKKSDPKLAEAIEKRQDAKRSPEEKMVNELKLLNASMKNMTPEALAGAFTTAAGAIGKEIAAAIPGGNNNADGGK